MTAQTEDQLALRALAERYARGVDRRDREMFVAAFCSDARLTVYNPTEAAEPVTDRRGHDELGAIPGLVARYDRTYHFIGNTHYDIGDGRATGEVYCMAHHLTRDEGKESDYVMYIRYEDEYRRDDTGAWLIADRRVNVDWTERRGDEIGEIPGASSVS